MRKIFFFGVILILSTQLGFAQIHVYQIDGDKSPIITISGESTLHDWTVQAPVVIGFPENIKIDLSSGKSIDNFGFKVEVKSMDGGRGASMNEKIYAALKKDQHGFIVFQQKDSSVITAAADEHNFNLISNGILEMAGASKEIEVNVSVVVQEGILIFSGNKSFKMSDFNIEPPSAMFGQIQTKDDVRVAFEFRYLLID